MTDEAPAVSQGATFSKSGSYRDGTLIWDPRPPLSSHSRSWGWGLEKNSLSPWDWTGSEARTPSNSL